MERMGKEKQGQMIVYHLIDLLKQGYRLPAPENCPAEVSRLKRVRAGFCPSSDLFFSFQIHAIMLECWSSNPELRPSFKALIHSVEAARGGLDR